MSLVKSSFFTFIATSVKILSSLIINKFTSIIIGPSGLAIVGQFQNFSQIAMIFSQGGINNGVTKYLAESNSSPREKIFIIGTSIKIIFFFSFVGGITIIILNKWAAQYFLGNVDYYYLFIIFGISIIFYALNSLVLSILNGFQDLRNFTLLNILQSLVTLVITIVFVEFFGLRGILLALVTNQSIVFILVFIILFKKVRARLYLKFQLFDKKIAYRLLKFSLMTAVTAILTPTSLLIIRNILILKVGIETAGIWQALWYISAMHLMMITTTLSVYYLPKLASINDEILLRKEIFLGYSFMIPIVLFSSFVIFFFRDFFIAFLFSKSFYMISDLISYQLFGDILKIASWLLSYLMVAKAMTRIYIFSEIFFLFTFTVLSYFLINEYKVVGVTYAYLINNLFYFIFLVLKFKRILFPK